MSIWFWTSKKKIFPVVLLPFEFKIFRLVKKSPNKEWNNKVKPVVTKVYVLRLLYLVHFHTGDDQEREGK